jgi:hypothetical protein
MLANSADNDIIRGIAAVTLSAVLNEATGGG